MTADRGDIDWIVADGEITAETPKDFRRFLTLDGDHPGDRLEVHLNSPGGNLIGGIQLGEIIREFGLGARVARTVPCQGCGPALPNGRPEDDAPGQCYSACAFAFLGGKWRIADGGSIGVHQHYYQDALADPNTPKFTAGDFSQQEVIDGILLEYVVKMGADPKFLTYAVLTAPTNLYLFTSSELKQYGITWNDLEYTDWNLIAYQNGLIAQSKTRNGEHTATLLCRSDHAVRLVINEPVNQILSEHFKPFLEKYLQPFLDGKAEVKANLFDAEIPPKNISGHIEHARLIIEIQLPQSLSTSDNNWLPDGKTPAWYVRQIRAREDGELWYDPTGAEWKTLTPERRQYRLQDFEKIYQKTFGTKPTFAADGNPVVPKEMPTDFDGLSAPFDEPLKDYFAEDVPGINFLTYSKLVGRNCITPSDAQDHQKSNQ